MQITSQLYNNKSYSFQKKISLIKKIFLPFTVNNSNKIEEILNFTNKKIKIKTLLKKLKHKKGKSIGLILDKQDFNDNDIFSLINSIECNNIKLKKLSLANNKIKDSGAVIIANSKQMKYLSYLNINNNQLGDYGIKAIAESKYMKNISILEFEYTNVSLIGLTAIANSKYMQKLLYL